MNVKNGGSRSSSPREVWRSESAWPGGYVIPNSPTPLISSLACKMGSSILREFQCLLIVGEYQSK